MRKIKNIIILLNILMIILAPLSPVLAASDNGNGAGNSGGSSGNSGGNGAGNSGGSSGNSGGNGAGNSGGSSGNSGGNGAGNSGGNIGSNDGSGGMNGINRYGKSGNNDNQARQSARESKLKKILAKKEYKNLLLNIPFTNETPYTLKQQSYGTVIMLQGEGADSRRLERITELMSRSLDRSLWLDDRHILSSDVFKYDMRAAQDIKTLLDREKNPTLPQDEMIYSFIKLIQSDKMLAYIGIQDMEILVERIPAEKSTEFEQHLDKAIDYFAKAEDLIAKGSYVLAVQQYNLAWTESFGFMIQNGALLPPRVFIIPADGSYTNSSDQKVAGAVSNFMVFWMTDVNITRNGITTSVPLMNGRFEHDVTLEENLNTIEVSAVNYFGKVGTAKTNVTLDTVLPEITITGIEEGAYYSHNVSAAVDVSDLHLSTSSILLDGKPYTAGVNIFSEGGHTLVAKARDLAGNSASRAVNFTIDKMQPEVRILYPANGAFVGQTVSIDGDVSDLNPNSVTLRVDGVKVSGSADFAWDTTAYPDGIHTITLEAIDKVGNSASTSVEVLVDNAPPEVIVKKTFSFYLRRNITLDADVTDANLESVSVRMDGSEISTSLPYEMDTSLYPDGNHTIDIYAFDKAGNIGGKGVKVNFDNSAPEINLTLPLNASFVKRSVEIRGSVNDPNLLAYIITVDGIAVYDSLPYLWNTFDYRDGNHIIRIDAADNAGNRASKEITVKVDNTPAEGEITFRA